MDAVWDWPDATLTFSLEHGRVLQVRVAGHDALWTSEQPAGWDVGGDRLWFGPEYPWFWRDPEADDYVVRPEIDPGSWRIDALDEHTCRIEQRVDLHDLHGRGTVPVRARREFTWLAPTRPGEARYESVELLELRPGGPVGLPVDLWNIVQVPAGGVLHLHYRGMPRWRDYFEAVDSGRMYVAEDAIRLDITGLRRFKVGLTASTSTGRAVYRRPVPGGFLVLDRSFEVRPGESYADLPRACTTGPDGDVVQAYNDDGRNGGYGELQHHSPALLSGLGPHQISARTTTAVYLLP